MDDDAVNISLMQTFLFKMVEQGCKRYTCTTYCVHLENYFL